MGGEISADSIYNYCCGESEDTETKEEIESEYNRTETPQEPDIAAILAGENVTKSLLNKTSNDALDSFLKHQFSELTPEIIKAQGLDPLNEVWTDEISGILFKAQIKLGPLTNLSQLIYDDLDLDDINIKYDETLHLRTGLKVSIRIRDTESLNLLLIAKIGIMGSGIDLSIPAKGAVHVHGVKVKCNIGLVHSLDIEWNDRNKSIEGILNNNLSLISVDLVYDKIVVSIIRQNIGDVAPTVWHKIEEAISKTITDIFKNQITKLLNKIMKKEMEKVLKQINDEVPRFQLAFSKVGDVDNEIKEEDNDVDDNVIDHSKKQGNKLLNQLRKLKL